MPKPGPDLRLEVSLGAPGRRIAGVDEVGRGPLAGPVIAAAVVLPSSGLAGDLTDRIDDSKRVRAADRPGLAAAIQAACPVGIGAASVAEIDRVNILQATFLAMVRALADLPGGVPDLAIVDGKALPADLPCPGRAIVGGDRSSLSIAAASIVAKVHRDRIMAGLAAECPGYGWERNAGYSTAEHRSAIQRLGITRHHRRSFRPCSDRLLEDSKLTA